MRSEAARFRNELTAGNFEVYVARDVISATQALSIFRPDIVLTQLRLTTYGGLELLRRLKDDPENRSIPVILYSDMATAGERIQALEIGAVDVLTKPFVSDEVIARCVQPSRPGNHSLYWRSGHIEIALQAWLTEECLKTSSPDSGIGADATRPLYQWQSSIWTTSKRSMILMATAPATKYCETASVLANSVRSSDLVARYGGEEFVVVAPSCSISLAVELTKRFRAKLADRRITVGGTPISVTASVGIAAADSAQHGPAEMLRQADEALYQAKRSGRDAIWVYDRRRGSQQSPWRLDPALARKRCIWLNRAL